MKNAYYYIGRGLERFPMYLFEDTSTFLPVRVVGLTAKGHQIYEKLSHPFSLSDTSDYVMIVNPTSETLTLIVLLGLKYSQLTGGEHTSQLDAILAKKLDSKFTIGKRLRNYCAR